MALRAKRAARDPIDRYRGGYTWEDVPFRLPDRLSIGDGCYSAPKWIEGETTESYIAGEFPQGLPTHYPSWDADLFDFLKSPARLALRSPEPPQSVDTPGFPPTPPRTRPSPFPEPPPTGSLRFPDHPSIHQFRADLWQLPGTDVRYQWTPKQALVVWDNGWQTVTVVVDDVVGLQADSDAHAGVLAFARRLFARGDRTARGFWRTNHSPVTNPRFRRYGIR